jgi:hypothetical protein
MCRAALAAVHAAIIAAGAHKGRLRRIMILGGPRVLRGDVAQGINDAVDDLLDQQAVLALAHDPDHRFGTR